MAGIEFIDENGGGSGRAPAQASTGQENQIAFENIKRQTHLQNEANRAKGKRLRPTKKSLPFSVVLKCKPAHDVSLFHVGKRLTRLPY